jgi:hypothetical protein
MPSAEKVVQTNRQSRLGHRSMSKTEARFVALILVAPFGFLIITALLIALGVRWIGLKLFRAASSSAGVMFQRPRRQPADPRL